MRRMASAALALVSGVFSACAVDPGGSPHTWQGAPLVEVSAEVNANANLATALDIVLIYDAKPSGLMPKTAPEWFAAKAALTATFPQQINVVSLHVPPATAIHAVNLPTGATHAVRVLAYANYVHRAGHPVADISNYKCVRIALAEVDIKYTECG